MGSTTLARLTGELFGTALLVFFGVGALLTGGSLLVAAVGLMIAAATAVWIFGGQLNPWLTLAAAIRGSQDWPGAAAIIAAQLAGGFLGGLLMWLVYGTGGIAVGLGANRLPAAATSGVGLLAAIVAEALAVLVLVCVSFALGENGSTQNGSTQNGSTQNGPAQSTPTQHAGTEGSRGDGLRGDGPWGDGARGRTRGGIAVGLAYAGGLLAIFTVTGASLNFARTLGPELTLAVAGGDAHWTTLWVYAASGAIGAALAGLLYPLFQSPRTTPDRADADAG